MTTPTFLGIGTVRGGSTWLHELLLSHPDVWMPSKRKELIYFDRLYRTRSLEWYLSQFADAPDTASAIGEISPTYLASSGAAKRIRHAFPDLDRLLVILRDPAPRAWSEYQWRRRHDHVEAPLEVFLTDQPECDRGSRYRETLLEYLTGFDRQALLILISEEAFVDPVAARTSVADHLGISPDGFPEQAGFERVNEGGMPRFPQLFSLASRARRALVRRDLDVVPRLAKSIGLRRLLIGDGGSAPKPTAEQLQFLNDRYADDRLFVSELLGREIPSWGHVSSGEQSEGDPLDRGDADIGSGG